MVDFHYPDPNRRTPFTMTDVCRTTLFDNFASANTFKGILTAFNRICADLRLDPLDYQNFYTRLKSSLNSWKAEKLWALLDNRAGQKEYKKQKACQNLRVLIIGAGPCGLRLAIECALLGCKVVLLEKRDRFSRNNVLHFWPFVIHDLRALGAKFFFPRFCAGSIDHMSIRQLQCVLLKIALVLGVEIHENVAFTELVQPERGQDGRLYGWRANVIPEDHYVSDYEFDVLFGADGKRNTVPGFRRKEFRGKLAIAVTANFINRRTEAEERVPEISGVAFVFNQQFFKDLRQATGIDLENIVYYKDDTHYFVMTAKKQSLLEKGVIKKDADDIGWLLSAENVDQEALLAYAREAADFATEGALPRLDYALNHYGHPDVAMFDFTSLFSAEYSCRYVERLRQRLLIGVVGDSLHEPFWPTGSGCARGFLGAFDAVWMLKQYCCGGVEATVSDILAERESAYRLLAQTTPENLSKSIQAYTIDPRTRYPRFEATILSAQVRGLIDTDNPAGIDEPLAIFGGSSDRTCRKDTVARNRSFINQERDAPSTSADPESLYVRHQQLARWYRWVVAPYRVRVDNLTTSFRSGLALLAVLRRYRPDLMSAAGGDERFYADVKSSLTSTSNWQEIRSRAFDAIKKAFDLDPPLSLTDKEAVFNYLLALKEILVSTTPHLPDVPTVSENESPARSARMESDDRPRAQQQAPAPSIYGHETEEQRQERYKRRLQALQNAEELFGANAQSKPKSTSALSPERTRFLHQRPANVEKLAGERLKEVEMMLMGNVIEPKREIKQKQPIIKMHKLDRREIEEMEHKLRETGMGCLLNHPIEPSLSSKESKVIAVKTSILKERAKDAFKERNTDKYNEFDKKLKDLDKWLDKPNLSGAVGVKNLLGQHEQIVEHVAVPSPAKKPAVPPPVPPKTSPSTPVPYQPPVPPSTIDTDPKQPLCHICNQPVYLAEKLNVENLACHRRCFRCAYCDAPLKLNGYGMERIEYDGYGKQFFCMQHLNLNLLEKVSKIKAKREKQQQQLQKLQPRRETAADFQPTRQISSVEKVDSERVAANSEEPVETVETVSSFDSLSQSRDLLSSGVFYSSNTPERAEFEVSLRRRPLMTDAGDFADMEKSKENTSEEELDEEEMLRHNGGEETEVEKSKEIPTLRHIDEGEMMEEVERASEESESDELLSDEERALTNLLDKTGGVLPSLDETVMLIQSVKTSRRAASRENLDSVDDDEVICGGSVDREVLQRRSTGNQHLTSADTTLYFTPNENISPTKLGDSVFKTPARPCADGKGGTSARQRLLVGLEKTRAEARARARLKSDEELCMAVSNRSGARYRSSSLREQALNRTKSHEVLSPRNTDDADSTRKNASTLDVAPVSIMLRRKTVSEDFAPNGGLSTSGGSHWADDRGDAGAGNSTTPPKKAPSFLSKLLSPFSPPSSVTITPSSPSPARQVASSESNKETSLLSKIGWKYGPNKRRSRGSLSPQQSLDTHDDVTDGRPKCAPKATVDEADLSDDSPDLNEHRRFEFTDKPGAEQQHQASVCAKKDTPMVTSFSVSRSSDSLLSGGSNVSDREVRRVQHAAAKIVRQAENKRYRQAGEVQRQMEELEVKKQKLNEEGTAMEKQLQKDPKNRSLLERWLMAVEERGRVNHYEQQLLMQIREFELENQHHQLQQLFRERLTSPSQGEKTSKQMQEEQQLLEQMLHVVSQRDVLLSDLEKLRTQDSEMYEPTAIARKVNEQLKRKDYDFRKFSIVFTAPPNRMVGPGSSLPTVTSDERRSFSALDSVI